MKLALKTSVFRSWWIFEFCFFGCSCSAHHSTTQWALSKCLSNSDLLSDCTISKMNNNLISSLRLFYSVYVNDQQWLNRIATSFCHNVIEMNLNGFPYCLAISKDTLPIKKDLISIFIFHINWKSEEHEIGLSIHKQCVSRLNALKLLWKEQEMKGKTKQFSSVEPLNNKDSDHT